MKLGQIPNYGIPSKPQRGAGKLGKNNYREDMGFYVQF
ncbi:MAG: hypothetical protein ACJAUO_001515 [Sediminicola sp.]|jgi:hypothetical protein